MLFYKAVHFTASLFRMWNCIVQFDIVKYWRRVQRMVCFQMKILERLGLWLRVRRFYRKRKLLKRRSTALFFHASNCHEDIEFVWAQGV